MKLFNKTLISVCIAALPASVMLAQGLAQGGFSFAPAQNTAVQAPLRAAEDEGLMTLGWTMTSYGNTMQVQRQDGDVTGHDVHAAAFFPKEVLRKFKGDRIKYVDFAVSPKVGSNVTVFVSNNLESGMMQAVGSTDTWEEGWNRCQLSMQYPITGEEDLYVGYVVRCGDNESLNTITYDNSLDGADGHNWYGSDGNWYKLPSDRVPGNFRIRAIIDGDVCPNNDVAVEGMTSDGDYVVQNQPWGVTLAVRNYGKTPVTGMHVQASIDGKVVSETDTDDDFELAEGELGYVPVSGLVVPSEGMCNVTLSVTKVNGVDDGDMSDNSVSHTFYSYPADAKPQKHNVLVEQFTAEYYDQAPAADELYAGVIDKRSDVVWVKHHTKYKGVADKFTAEGEDAYASELYGGAKQFVPALMADRRVFQGQEDPGPAYFVDDADNLKGMIAGAKSVPTYVTLGIDATTDNTTANITVNGTSQVRQLQEQTDLRLNLWVVEDSILSTTQNGRDEYTQNGVLRRIVSDVWGDPVDVADKTFSRSYTVECNPEWNLKNVRLVAFVSNYDKSERKRQVYNTVEQKLLGQSTGIAAVAGDTAAVTVKNGVLVVPGNCRIAGVYDMAGCRVNAARRLTPGMYLVQVTEGGATHSQKLLVK